MKNHIIEMLNAAGYSNTGDNRNYVIRSLNTLIDSGLLEIVFIPAERVNAGSRYMYTGNDGKRHGTGYKFQMFGKWYAGHWMPKNRQWRMWGETGIEPIVYRSIDITKLSAQVARIMEINRSGFDSIRAGVCECAKCNGKGVIPAFAHVCKGICFDCAGTGVDRRDLYSYIRSQISKNNG